MRSPAVLLISPGMIRWDDADFGLPHLVALGGYLQHHTAVRVEILDLGYEGGDQRHLLDTLSSLGPFLAIGVSCYSSFDYLRVLSLGRFLKLHYPDVPLITGGYHASALPGDLLFDGSPFDAVVVGEGEVPLLGIVEQLLGGGTLERKVHGPANVEDLEALPPYQWQLLQRYWPRATALGRKLQIYLSRGCPYRCTFCMERAKTEYAWRAFGPERAVEEIARLGRHTDLSKWVVNIADPLFGFKRSWRRQVLEGLIARGLVPRQFWTLTRSDDLDDEDVSLLARARFSIGIGAETGSPSMVERMQKANNPEKYLAAIERLAGLSLRHGLNWAANIIVGHPGETMQSMKETRDFVGKLFTAASATCGWVSIDPFRLYPGALVHEQLGAWSEKTGARFHHPEWWKSWYDASFRAEHVDPSDTLDYEARVRFAYEAYPPLMAEIARRFRGQGRSVDRVFERSLAEQEELMSPRVRDRLLARAAAARRDAPKRPPLAILGAPPKPSPLLHRPIGLEVQNPWVRKREEAVRRLLDAGVLRTERLIDALLEVAPEEHLSEEDAEAMLLDRAPRAAREGDAPPWLGIRVYAIALEALAPRPGDRAIDLTASRGYVTALLRRLVGESGAAIAHRGDPTVLPREGLLSRREPRPFDAIFAGGALPSMPPALRSALVEQGGRAVLFLGPRFRPQDMVCVERRGGRFDERRLARVQVPVLRGHAGWLAA